MEAAIADWLTPAFKQGDIGGTTTPNLCGRLQLRVLGGHVRGEARGATGILRGAWKIAADNLSFAIQRRCRSRDRRHSGSNRRLLSTFAGCPNRILTAPVRRFGSSADRTVFHKIANDCSQHLLVFALRRFGITPAARISDAPGCFSIKSSISFSAASMVLDLSGVDDLRLLQEACIHFMSYLPLLNR